jgi:uncharacterized membrane protein
MTETWIVILAVGVATVAAKAAGPVLLGGRQLGPRTLAVVELIAPVLLVALVLVQAFGDADGATLDVRIVGIAVAGVALLRGLSIVPAMVLAAAVTALLRLLA